MNLIERIKQVIEKADRDAKHYRNLAVKSYPHDLIRHRRYFDIESTHAAYVRMLSEILEEQVHKSTHDIQPFEEFIKDVGLADLFALQQEAWMCDDMRTYNAVIREITRRTKLDEKMLINFWEK